LLSIIAAIIIFHPDLPSSSSSFPLPFFRPPQSIAMRIAAPRCMSWLLQAYVICQMSLHHV
jgi:hypothetical protein